MALIDRRPWETCPITGKVTKWYEYDEDTDEVIIEDVIDWDAYGEFNKEARKENTGRFGDGMAWIGSMPMPIYWRLKERGIFDDPKLFRRWWLSDESLPFRGRDMRL